MIICHDSIKGRGPPYFATAYQSISLFSASWPWYLPLVPWAHRRLWCSSSSFRGPGLGLSNLSTKSFHSHSNLQIRIPECYHHRCHLRPPSSSSSSAAVDLTLSSSCLFIARVSFSFIPTPLAFSAVFWGPPSLPRLISFQLGRYLDSSSSTLDHPQISCPR